jgi:hypothetical protein
LELRRLEYFVAVARELHFRRAAESFPIAQSALSYQIKELESDLGIPLLKRTTRRVELTPAGEIFLQHAERLLNEVAEARRAATRAHAGEIGRIAVGFGGSVTYELMPRLARTFGAAFPEVALERINAVLIIVAKPSHLEFAQKWVLRLDQAPANSRQVYVVQGRNRDATEGAGLLQEVFSGRALTAADLLGVKAVITESFERIHRSNLIGMGVVPLQFPAGESADSLGLDGTEIVSITGLEQLNEGSTPRTVHVVAAPSEHSPEGKQTVEFDAVVRIDTPGEADYYRNGGILQYVLRKMLRA